MSYGPASSGPFLGSQLSNTSYRARRAGPDGGQRTLKLAAAGLGGLLLLGAVGYGIVGRRPSTIPVIEADSRPLKVKPENPGGMQITGADELSDDRSKSDRMAPTAEVPAPQALRAQMQQAAPATPAAVAPMAATVAQPGAQQQGTGPGASPLPDTPAKTLAKSAVQAASVPATVAAAPVAAGPGATPSVAPVVVPAPTPAVTMAAPRPVGGVTLVQLGALASEAAARSEWQRLGRSAPGLLDGREPVVSKIERDGRTYWRLRTGGFSDIADATGFCAKLKAKGGSCAVADF